MKPSQLDSDKSNYIVCPIGPRPKIGAFHPGANFWKLNRLIIPKNIQFHKSNFNFVQFDQLVLYSSPNFSVITRNNVKLENKPNDVQNLQITYQWKAQETRNISVPSPWSKGCGGGRNTRSNSRTNLFLPYLSNGDESREKDHKNEFRGSKNGGNKLWGGLKWSEMVEKSRNVRLPSVAAAATSPARCFVWSNLPRLANGQNDPTRVHKFWRASLEFWSSKWCFGG